MYTHPWLELYPIKETSKRLILGTHPPMPYDSDKEHFFYCNRNEFWKLISRVYPNNNFFKNGIFNIENIDKFLIKYNFSITDLIYKTNNNRFSTDTEIKVSKLNPYLKDWIFNSDVSEIYFTSFNSGKNSAFSIFKKWLTESRIAHEKVPPIKLWLWSGHSTIINGRVIKLIALFSPSPAARRGIPNSKAFAYWKETTNLESKNVDEFRFFWYKKFFPQEIY